MKNILFIAVLLLFAGFGVFAEGEMEMGPGSDYAGREACAQCHSEIYDTFMQSGHPFKLNKVVDGNPPDYPYTEVSELPEGYDWDDITYVIGGYNWKARFIGKDGFIITGPEGDEPYGAQYNFANPIVGNEAGWVPYHQGEKKPYNCGPCHTTGYTDYPPDVHQDNLPGLIGTWSEPGIQCEACHGPSSQHVNDPRGVTPIVDRSPELCGECHYRSAPEAVDASGGFIKHHEQYEELYQSKHIALDCVLCHNPHAGVIALRKAEVATTRVSCENCHFQEAKYQASEVMKAAVDCIECHMPRVTKSAVGNIAKYTGDIRTHLMAIDATMMDQFTEDGKFALSQIGLNFACKSCHVDGGMGMVYSDAALLEEAYGYHDRPPKM